MSRAADDCDDRLGQRLEQRTLVRRRLVEEGAAHEKCGRATLALAVCNRARADGVSKAAARFGGWREAARHDKIGALIGLAARALGKSATRILVKIRAERLDERAALDKFAEQLARSASSGNGGGFQLRVVCGLVFVAYAL